MNNKDINDLYKSTMDNVTMPQDDKDNLRAKLAEQAQTDRSGRRLARVGKYAAIAAAVCAVLLCIPATRTTVSAAIDYIKQTFHMANGAEVTYEENSEGNSIQFTISTDDDNGYTKVENGRLYFVLDDTKEDITDKCGTDKYFRHEINNEDGSRSVILIGGTPESCGWCELFFDKNGKYLFNSMNVEDYNDPWLNDALHAEGVDTGNPYLDDLAAEDAASDGSSNTDDSNTASNDSSSTEISTSDDNSDSADTTASSDSVYSVGQSVDDNASGSQSFGQVTSGNAASGNATYIEQ